MNENNHSTETGQDLTFPPQEEALLPPQKYVKLEKNLTSLGVFSASSKTLKKPKAKTITVTRTENNRRFRGQIIIEPSVTFGLPTTAHQDKTLAFQKMLQERRRAGQAIKNPVGFHSSEILNLLDLGDGGENYKDLEEWLNVMTATLIISEATLFITSKQRFATDRFHIFERALSYGEAMPDGTAADMNYVWMADWLLDNINKGYLITIDFEAYKKLTTPIAKTLVPLLHVWFYAAENQEVFKKRYEDFCLHLGIQQYKYPSLIKQKLAAAMEELVSHGFLSVWNVEKGEEGPVIELWPGPKYFDDRREMKDRKARGLNEPLRNVRPLVEAVPRVGADTKPIQAPAYEEALVAELVSHGLAQHVAVQLATSKPQQCRKQLDLLPFQTITKNKAGFLRRAIEAPEGYAAPAGYEKTQQEKARSTQRKAIQERQDARRSEIIGRLIELANVLINDHAEQITDFLRFFQEERDRVLSTFPKKEGRMYNSLVESYHQEPKQLELMITFFASHPCPVQELADLIQQQKPTELKNLVRAYFEPPPEK